LKYLYFNFKDVFNDYDEKEKREEKKFIYLDPFLFFYSISKEVDNRHDVFYAWFNLLRHKSIRFRSGLIFSRVLTGRKMRKR
jgi:hypothetical protein